MDDSKFFFTQVFYTKYLTSIAGKSVSKREADVLACILTGRPAKGIGRFLSISDRTVESHTYNIMTTFECSSRESLISFIERSDKFLTLREYYVKLLVEVAFESLLKKISYLANNPKKNCLIIYPKEEETLDPFIKQLRKDLKLVGIETSIEGREKAEWTGLTSQKTKFEGYQLYIVPKAINKEEAFPLLENAHKYSFSNLFFLFLEKSETADKLTELSEIGWVNFDENYYYSVFELLKRLLPDVNFDDLIEKFKGQSNPTNDVLFKQTPEKIVHIGSELTSQTLQKNALGKRKWYLIGATIAFISVFTISGAIYFTGKERQITLSTWSPVDSPIRSDLSIPNDTTLLNRSELITQLNEKFQENKGIQTIALVGIGGSGKTTLARQYAHTQKANIVWEFNAETSGVLYESFEKLAHALSKTENDQKLLRGLLEIKNTSEKKEKLVTFVRERFNLHSPWFLIFDNIEYFSDIQEYFPRDSETWGQGKVILTTRNTNIQNSPFISHIITIGELTSQQKQALFTKIMNGEKSHANKNREILAFLECIPPFPLDVSIAAYYLKSTNIPYKQYLEKLGNYVKETNELHEVILKEAGEYTETRYTIITHSLEHIIKNHKDFADLLLFISLLDSQNIPKSLLDQYKGSSIADNFIYYLKKYSLLTAQAGPSSSEAMYSMHRSSQVICLDYIRGLISSKEMNKLMNTIVRNMGSYALEKIGEGSSPIIKILASHFEKILNHKDVLSLKLEGILAGKLGGIYFCLGNYAKAKQMLEKSLALLKTQTDIGPTKIAHILEWLGNTNRELGYYKKAVNLLENSVSLYRNSPSKNSDDLARTLACLGNAYRNLGEVTKAKCLLEESLEIYRKDFPHHHAALASVLGYLGHIYWILGNYKDAKTLDEESYWRYKNYCPTNEIGMARSLTFLGNTYNKLGKFKVAQISLEKAVKLGKKYYGDNHIDVAWSLLHLGSVYTSQENYTKAKEVLEKVLEIYRRHYNDNHIDIAWVSVYLGSVYSHLGDHEQAISLLEKSHKTYEKTFGAKHTDTAWVLTSLGRAYLLKGLLLRAEACAHEALKIFHDSQHSEAYTALEILGDICTVKIKQAQKNLERIQLEKVKSQGRAYYEAAMAIIKFNFSEKTPHEERIQSKLQYIGQSIKGASSDKRGF